MPSTPADVRTIALALDGASEVDHFGRAAFRTKRRIFVSVDPKNGRANIVLPPERMEFLWEAAPAIFTQHFWGKATYMLADLARLERKELEGLIREAWEHAAPAKPKRRAR